MTINLNCNYSSIELIEDLSLELQNYPELLAKIFPNRILRYSDSKLSSLLGYHKSYIAKIRYKYKKARRINFDDIIEVLKIKLINNLGVKALGCFKIVKLFQDKNIIFLEFLDALNRELGRVSGNLKVLDEELSIILVRTTGYIKGIRRGVLNNNSNYKFAESWLNRFSNVLG